MYFSRKEMKEISLKIEKKRKDISFCEKYLCILIILLNVLLKISHVSLLQNITKEKY